MRFGVQSAMLNLNDFILGSSKVHVWAIWLNASDEVSASYRALLTPEEVARADKFAFDHLRKHYQVSQGALRILLARYLNCQPCELSFTLGPRGKPVLNDEARLRFNLSNSGNLALYSFTSDCEVGIDVEQFRELQDLESIAAKYFCDAETSQLLSIESDRARQEAFFRCWTRKEAYIKAVGTGLYLPLDQFQVTLLPNDAPGFVHIGESATEAQKWTLHHLDSVPHYIGAIAYRAATRNVVFYNALTPVDLLRQPA